MDVRKWVMAVLLAAGSPVSGHENQDHAQVPAIGSELTPCENCPTFVRVPDAPDTLRPIRYVSKYELTWKNYIASINEGDCPVPSKTLDYETDGIKGSEIVEHLRIDWPISILNQGEIECYIEWVQERSLLPVAIPSADEWDWFALGDIEEASFPWGDEKEAPAAAVPGVDIRREDEFVTIWNKSENLFVEGVRVVLFPPNTWGLFDIVGNQKELTSSTFSGEEWLKMNPQIRYREGLVGRDVVMIKGGDRYSRNWAKGLGGKPQWTRVIDGRFSTRLAVRLVLIEGGECTAHVRSCELEQ